jgi:hypothetical protein
VPRTLPRPNSRTIRTALKRRRAATALALGGLTVAGAVGAVSVTGAASDEAAAADAPPKAWTASSERSIELPDKGLPRASRNAIREQVREMRPTLDGERAERDRGGAPKAKPPTPDNPREIAMQMLPDYGWDASTFSCLDELWVGESNWDVHAENPTSGAYGIPQALPAAKMASAGADWETNAATQIEWGLGYIRDVYGDPCSANSFKQANNWY